MVARGSKNDSADRIEVNAVVKSPDLKFEFEKAWRLASAPFRHMPSWVLAGAPKCGTSTLYDYLVDHPQSCRGARKEPTNFLHFPGSRFRAAMNYPLRTRALTVGDASVEYFSHPDGACNVHAVIPEARLIFIFRDPVARAWSDYQMFCKSGHEHESFDVVVRRAAAWLRDDSLTPLVRAASREAYNPVRILLCGMYARCLIPWLDHFRRDQCLFLMSEEFFRNPECVVKRARAHVGLPEAPFRQLPVARDGGGREKMSDDTRAFLEEFFAPENALLERMLESPFPWGREER